MNLKPMFNAETLTIAQPQEPWYDFLAVQVVNEILEKFHDKIRVEITRRGKLLNQDAEELIKLLED